MDKRWWHKRFLSIRWMDYGIFLGAYILLSFIYHVTIWINGLSWEPDRTVSDIFDLERYISTAGLKYASMLLLTLPIWWLLFRKLAHLKLRYRLLMHIIGLPVFVIAGQQLHYSVADWLEIGHLRGYGQVWDLFIPALFYCFQFGVLHAYYVYREQQEGLRLQSELRQVALQSELSALKAQLNPHFLYNVFNTISASVPADQEQTREMIARLSDLFRYQLRGARAELLPLRDELEMVQNYLHLEHCRFGDRLTYRFEVDDDTKSRMVPPMLLQPLVENAVQHGISPRIEGGTITVKVTASAHQTNFEIADNGVGFQDKPGGEGVGLETTRQRLQKRYGEELKLETPASGGVTVKFSIPNEA